VAKSQSHGRFAGARAAHDLRCVATIADALRALADLLNLLQCVANLGTHGARIDGAAAASPISGGDVFDLQMVVPEKRDALGREVIDALGGDCSHHYANDMISRTAMVASSFTSVRLLRKSIAQVRQKNPTGAIHGFDPLRSPDRA
jgi:hypothetical protein